MRALVVAVLVLMLMACSGGNDADPANGQAQDTTTPDDDPDVSLNVGDNDTEGPTADASDPPADVPVDPPLDVPADTVETRPPVAAQYHTAIGGWTMKPGKETTKCVIQRLDNPGKVFVTGIHAKLGKGSHHLIVYKSTATEERVEPFGCTPFLETLDGQTFPLMITQIAEETLLLPDGIAFEFEPNQMIRLEAHYLNYYDEEITTDGKITFDTVEEKDVTDTANMLFYGTPDFDIKPGQETQTPWNFLEVWEGTKIFGLTGHTHAYGTNVEVRFSESGAEMGDEIYPLGQAFDWDEAPVIQYDPPLEFGKGAGFHYRCTWFNTGDKSVGFGESANQEMCFVWAYYYPSKGYRMCVNLGGIIPGVGQVCCPDLGDICKQIKNFL